MKLHSFSRLSVAISSIAVFVVSFFLLSSVSVLAVGNNTDGLPDWIPDDMVSQGQTTNPNSSSRKPCRGGFNNAQFGWISLEGKSTVQQVILPAGTNSLGLQFNAAGATCDSIINTSGKITNFSLKRTNSKVTSVTSSAGSITGTGSILGKSTEVDFNSAQYLNFRYTEIENLRFSLSGLGGLGSGSHTVQITITYVPVNRFEDGRYTCVDGGRDVTPPGGAGFNASCPPVTRSFPITIVVPESKAGSCSVTVTSPTNGVIVPGQEVKATIAITNSGADAWSVMYPPLGKNSSVRLGIAGDSNSWSPDPANINIRRVAITPSTTGTFGPVVMSGQTTNTPVTLKAPGTLSAGTAGFEYRVLEENRYDSSGNALPGRQFGASCGATFQVKENRPFIRVNGSDVVSGATFGTGQNGMCTQMTSNSQAAKADIKTNGSRNREPEDLNGFSSSQYAVFASGEIGGSPPNNFVGNSGYRIDDTTQGQTLNSLSFANQNIPSGDYLGDYGHFYGDLTSAIPCLDTSEIQSQLVNASGNFQDLLNNSATFVKVSGHLDVSGDVNTQKVIFVEGDVTVTGPVTYKSYGYENGVPKPPYLMIIATNGIQINSAASMIDGHYVSLPMTASDGDPTNINSGRLDTCANAAGASAQIWPPTGSGLTTTSCNRQLKVNGSIVARRILWKGTRGTIGNSDSAVDASCVVNNATSATSAESFNQRLEVCSSEFIKFNPEAYFGPLGTSTNGASNVPVSTQELPPIY